MTDNLLEATNALIDALDEGVPFRKGGGIVKKK